MRSKLFISNSGERLSILVDTKGFPLLYPNLFITSMYRNDDQAASSCKKAAEHLVYFYTVCEGLSIDIERRCETETFLSQEEIQNISGYTGLTQKSALQKLIINNKENNVSSIKSVNSKRLETARHTIRIENEANKVVWQTKYNRLTVFGRYLDWLQRYHFPYSDNKAKQYFFDERPAKNEGLTFSELHELLTFKSLNKLQRNIYLDRIRPEYPENPWNDEGVKCRNYAIAMLLYSCGLRLGELLNVKLEDLISKDGTPYVLIKRNPSDIDETRAKQPSVKTNSRALALTPKLYKIIQEYIYEHRALLDGVAHCPYLFVSHRKRNNKINPLSISAVEKIFREFSSIMAFHLHPHCLRHTWNDRYSESADKRIAKGETTEEKSEMDRCLLMGWAEGSTMSKVYSSRHNTQRAMEYSLKLQDEDFELKESLIYDDDVRL